MPDRRPSPVQRVPEAAMKPCFCGGIVMPWIDRLFPNVDVSPTEPGNLLYQPVARLRHQLVLAAGPELTPMGDGSRHAAAGRLNGVLTDRLRIYRRQVAMPEDDFGIVVNER